MRKHALALSCCLVLAAAIVLMFEASAQRPSSPPPSPPRSAAAAYSGNTNTHKFHRKGCRYYACPNCTAKFATREEAIAAGYRPCGTCEP